MIKDILLSDFTDERFQAAFRLYFAELGINVQDWDCLWKEMNTDKNAENHAYVRLDERGEVIGFIQFCEVTLTSWFFEEKCGFIREFWIKESLRGHGHGSALLRLAEGWCRDESISKCILTTETAPDFYQSHGYCRDINVAARNKDEVFTKHL